MKEITLKNNALTVGLHWEVLNHEIAEGKAVREAAARLKGAKYGVKVSMGRIGTLGLVQPGQKKPKAPSGAALLAFASQEFEVSRSDSLSTSEESNWIVIENLAGAGFWISIIKDGLPVPGADILENREGVFETLDEMLEPQAGQGFVVHCPDEGLRQSIAERWSCHITDKGFLDLTKDIKTKRGLVTQVSGIPPVYIAVIGGVLALGGIGYMLNTMHQQSVEAARRARNAQQEQQRLAEENKTRSGYQDKVRAAVLDALEKGAASVDKALSTPSPTQAVSHWLATAKSLPLVDAGWLMTGVSCHFKQERQPECTVNLSRGSYGINRPLMDAHPDAKFDGDKASYVLLDGPLQFRSSAWGVLDNAIVLNHGLLSDLQLLRNTGASYKMDASKEITQAVTVPPPPSAMFKPVKGQQAKEAAPVVQMGVASGTLTLSGDGLWELGGLSEMLESPNIAVRSVDMTINEGGAAWVMKADYFLRSLPQPQLPVIHLPDDTQVVVPLPAKYAAKSAAGGLSAADFTAPASATSTSGVGAPPPPPVVPGT